MSVLVACGRQSEHLGLAEVMFPLQVGAQVGQAAVGDAAQAGRRCGAGGTGADG